MARASPATKTFTQEAAKNIIVKILVFTKFICKPNYLFNESFRSVLIVGCTQ
jgi:hypothetical protein